MDYTATFTPIPFFDDVDKQWKPSVRQEINGYFVAWLVYDLGFDEPKYAMPYAREFARELGEQWKQSAEATLKTLTERWA
jgi:hypothetical protein